jgi:hypothetical protein
LKISSKVLVILTALFVIAIVVSAASAVNLTSNDFKNENFAINVTSGSNFTECSTTNINIGDMAMKMLAFENSGNNSNNVSAIIYLKDSSVNKSVISDFAKDLKKDNQVVEENENYTIVKINSSDDFSSVSLDEAVNDINSLVNGLQDIFSSKSDINISSDGSSFSLSDKGLQISNANGEGVSITSDGIKVSNFTDNASLDNATEIDNVTFLDIVSFLDNASLDNASLDNASFLDNASLDNASFLDNATEIDNVTFDGNFSKYVPDGEYAVYVQDNNNTQAIIIYGNNLDVLKSMAGTVSFK